MPMRSGVGWVSTELHLSVARSARRASDVLNGDRASAAAGDQVARWLGLDADLLERPFNHLSQGEQKLVLLGAALASEPLVLVLDEPMQGLDTTNRSRVLKLVESVCRAGGTTLVYITHHYEEVLPSVTHVMHLSGGDAVFIGPRAAYEESGLLG
jgi:molybdate transport system ATP-binding protein